jgi:cobalt-zinc-cadmium efflux system membrane fusion protein
MNTSMRALATLLASLSMTLAACGDREAATGRQKHDHAAEQAHGAEVEGAEHPEGIELSETQIRNAGIEFAAAGAAPIRETLTLYGMIVPNAERVRDVTARFPGVIETVNVAVGTAVHTGTRLATVESNESLRSYAVTAPISGVVTRRDANAGEQTGEKVLFVVADLSSVWVELSLFPRDVAKIRVGQSVQVRSAEAAIQGEGRIAYIAPIGASASQTVTARVMLPNPERRWAPGLYVTADVTLAEAPAAVVVRNEALQMLEERTVVFVQEDHGIGPRSVRLGRRDPTHSEVLEGLKPGERYATVNSFVLKSELGKGEAEHAH